MKRLPLLFLAVTLLAGASAFAGPTKLVKSTPENGSVSDSAPSAFVLEFSAPVAFYTAELTKDDEKPKPLKGGGHLESQTVTISAPALAPGHYVLEWGVFTSESLVLRGRVRFTVSAAAGAAPTTTPH